MKSWLYPLIVMLGCGALAAAAEPVPDGHPVIVLVGDSTVAPDGGWGDGFAKLLVPEVRCVNLAQKGRSSKSYRDEGFWKKVIEEKPAWVLIQFGHNDQPGKGPQRETDPQTTFRQNLLRYVDEAQAAGAKAVLVTSLTRRNFDGQGKILADGLVPYVAAVKALGAEKGIPVIDLNASSVELMEKLGAEKAAAFDRKSGSAAKTDVPTEPASAKNPDAKAAVDRTHLSAMGEQETAKLVAEGVRKQVPELAAYLKKAE